MASWRERFLWWREFRYLGARDVKRRVDGVTWHQEKHREAERFLWWHSFFSSLKTERTGRKTYRTRDEARADVFDYIECFYNPKRRHSTIGYLSPMEFESQAGLA
jgi:putative transposase